MSVYILYIMHIYIYTYKYSISNICIERERDRHTHTEYVGIARHMSKYIYLNISK